MELTERHKSILNAEICPYCGSKTRVTTETEVYGKEYKGRKVYVCGNFPNCDAYVGTHDDETPLGRLANKELRAAKIKAHFHFDKLWQEGFLNRTETYKLLTLYLNIPPEYTHIGMFSLKTCNEVSEWSKEMYNQLINNNGSNIRNDN